MPTFYNLQIPPPSYEQDFESLCCGIWKEIWKDPNTKKNGRKGQPQNGVDIYGRPNQGKLWSGIQCKCKNNDLNKNLTKSEVEEEIQKAKNFVPSLSEFIIATTGPKDAKIEEFARKVSDDNLNKGLFSVHIWGWDDIKNNLSEDLVNIYYPNFSSLVSRKDIDELISVIQNSKVLFIGDELSNKSDVKNFRIFLVEVIKSITDHKFDPLDYDELSQKLHAESAFKILHKELGDNILIYFEEFILQDPNPVHYYIANEIKKGKWVFTTNRDNLIERARLSENNLISDDLDFSGFNETLENCHNSSVGCLFKLNGSVDIRDKKIDIRFKSILDNLYKKEKFLKKEFLNKDTKIVDEKKELLEYFLKECDFCFLGFDCLDNFSFFPILKNTNTDKSMYCLNHTDKDSQKNIEIIQKKEDLENEIEKEICNTPRDTKTLHLNNILLKRNNFLKIKGNWIEIIQNKLCTTLNMSFYDDYEPIESVDYSKEKADLSEKVDDYKRNIIFGLLLEDCLSKVKAIEFFNKAKLISEKTNKAQHIKEIDKARAIQNMARVNDMQFGGSREEIVFDQYQQCIEIYNEIGFRYKAIQCKLGLANYKRRVLKRFNDALNDCEEIEKMLKEIDKEDRKASGNQIMDEEYCLIRAQYHSCVGLIYSTYEGTDYINESIDQLKCGLDYRKKVGDVKGVADSENNIGYIKVTKHNDNVGELEEAISHLLNALNINESIGNFIGAARNYRNLGLCYKDLVRLSEDKEIKRKSFQQAKDSYKNSLNYWYMITGEPPAEEVSECEFRLGELEIKYGNVYEGIGLLEKVDAEFEKRGKWHNRIRTLILLSEAYAKKRSRVTKGAAKQTIDKIISIYNYVLSDPVELKEQMKNNNNIYENAVEIIKNAKDITKQYEDKSISLEEFKERINSLDEILGKLRVIENEKHL